MRKVSIEKSGRIFDDFFKIEEAYLRFEQFDGEMSPVVRRLNFERGDSVAALLFNPQTSEVVLVNQFKYPTLAKGPGWITETMAGMIDKDESPEQAVEREILEETGYKALRLEHISSFYVSPGGTSERIFLYYAEIDDQCKVASGGGLASEGENIINVTMSLDEAVSQIASGGIVDAKTIVGILWLQNKLLKTSA